jgi:hypothetical protein
MPDDSLAQQMRMLTTPGEENLVSAGPFLAISRQFGCGGFSLGLLMLDLLNEETDADRPAFQIYHKEILERLATETDVATDILERRRRDKPRLLGEFFRTLGGKKDRVPSGMEIRNRMTSIIRGLAIEGHAILVGQSAALATSDLPNGLSVRLEAPEPWRVKQVAFREGLSETQAKLRLQEETERRDYLRRIYERKYPHKPTYNLTFDCEKFSLSQIAVVVLRAFRLLVAK